MATAGVSGREAFRNDDGPECYQIIGTIASF